MRFNLTHAVTALSLFSATVTAIVTPAQVVQNIQTLTEKSRNLQAPAQSINIINGPLLVVGLGPFPPIISGFADIVSTATSSLAAMQGSPDVTDVSAAALIANAFREFVAVHQALLNILIGKAGLFETVPLIGAPVAAALRQIEGIVDTIALALINMVESQATDITAQGNALSATLAEAITKYEGLLL